MDANREIRKVYGWWAIVALAIIALAFFSKEAKAQPVVRAPLAQGYGGLTTCNDSGKASIVISTSVSQENYETVLKHERVHAEQMKKHEGGCRGFEEHINLDPVWRVGQEGEAHCAVLVRVNRETVYNLVQYMKRYYAPWLSEDEITSLLPCVKNIAVASKDSANTVPR